MMHNNASSTSQSPTEAAGLVPAAAVMTNEERTFWQRYRMPIILGIIAVSLYAGSIIWMVFGRGQVL